MKCSRIRVLLLEVSNDWDNLNLSSKILIFLGLLIFFITIFIGLYNLEQSSVYNSIKVIFSSTLVSVFGFILSSNTNSNKFKIQDSVRDDKNKLEDECKKIASDRYNNEGNAVQILVAFFIATVLVMILLIIFIFKMNIEITVLSQFRDLICLSIGFLLGESKIRKKNK